jgi:hypothetical protein
MRLAVNPNIRQPFDNLCRFSYRRKDFFIFLCELMGKEAAGHGSNALTVKPLMGLRVKASDWSLFIQLNKSA